MESEWQFPYAFCAVDGCHLPMRCPRGSAEAQKAHRKFKNFYTVILIALVNAKYHLSGLVQGGLEIPMIQLFCSQQDYVPANCTTGATSKQWLQKPYSHAILTKKQSCLTYRLCRARMVVEAAFGMLKGRWCLIIDNYVYNIS